MPKPVLLLLLASCVARGGFQAGGASTPASGPPPSSEPVAAPHVVEEAFPPGSWTLAQREHWKKAYDEAMQHVNLMNETCKTQIAFRFEYEELRSLMTPTGLHGRAKGFASDVATIVRNVCLDGNAPYVKDKITAIVIGLPVDRRHRLAGGTLTGAVDPGANPRSYYYDFQDFVKGSL